MAPVLAEDGRKVGDEITSTVLPSMPCCLALAAPRFGPKPHLRYLMQLAVPTAAGSPHLHAAPNGCLPACLAQHPLTSLTEACADQQPSHSASVGSHAPIDMAIIGISSGWGR